MTCAWQDRDLARRARPAAGEVSSSLVLSPLLARTAEALGSDTWAYLRTLATLGSVDLTLARTLEPHLDAVAILHQAGDVDLERVGAGTASTWGVYAANAPGHGLSAVRDGRHWRISGTKAWCSLADRVSHALVTASVEGGTPGLFAIDLRQDGITTDSGTWVSRGLVEITTSTLTVNDVEAAAVGDPGWYLDRPGFAWGGIGVAAVWFGGAAAIAALLREAAQRREPDQVALMHLGHCDRILYAAELALRDAAARIDAGEAAGQRGSLLATRVRSVVADTAERVPQIVGHALGPGPLAHDEEHARRVADLTVYVRQHHAERDLAALGRLVLNAEHT